MGKSKELGQLEELATEEVERVLGALPEELRGPAEGVAVFFRRYNALEGDLLGVFEGAAICEESDGHPDAIPRITLFLQTIWELCKGDVSEYRKEVKVTFLHELGHYFGWDEDELELRGLG